MNTINAEEILISLIKCRCRSFSRIFPAQTQSPIQTRSHLASFSVHTQQHIDTGDIVYLYSDKSKLRSRCRYLVVSTEGDWLNISKFTGTQLRATSYRVKRTECYKVLSETGHDLPVSYE